MTESEMREPSAEWLTPQGAGGSVGSLPAPRVSGREQARMQWRISMRDIRGVARRIVECFQPQRIILFGSYAHGHPKPESDVDLLVIMETAKRSRQQRLEISQALSPRPFPLDIVVRTPQEIEERIALGDRFLREIITQGKVLYERHGD